MIFSKLFKTKATWQHKDATVRITAINDELSADNSEQLTILIDLISNDPSELVRRAALIKIGSFECYLEASRGNSQEKVKQFANKQIHDILTTDHNIVLSSTLKETLITQESQNPFLTTALLEAWLAHEQDSVIMISLYKLISKRKTSAQLLIQSFTQKQNLAFQTHILNDVTDEKVLEKLAKKACNSVISQHIQDKITAIKEAVEKPQKVGKQIQLTLAKLQALKDVADYADYKKRKSLLINEWKLLVADFDIFSADEVDVFNTKYENIINYLDKLFVAKAENYQQQIISDKLAHDKQQDKKEFSQQLSDISKSITTAVFSSDEFDETPFKKTLNELTVDIKASVLNEGEQQKFNHQVDQLTIRLGQIPEIAESVTQATHLISKISQLALPKTLDELNDRQETYNAWFKEWRVIEKKTAGILPETIVEAQKQIVSAWQGGLKPLQSLQKELFFQHKKKLHDIKRLLDNGKYKVCFGLFKGVKESFHQLSSQQQQQLQRNFDQVGEKMVELSDWEHYIATPRKQELVIAIQSLVETPLDNPNEQAAKVKEYRATWNSLGHADEDVDKALNEQFNQLCEQAFAPCRLFYAEQDKIREQHLEQRQNILARAEKLAASLTTKQEEPPQESIPEHSQENSQYTQQVKQDIDFKKVDGQLSVLQKEWNNAGEVDRNIYKKLQQQFRNLISPIQREIQTFQLNNAQEKQALITKAEALLASDDIFNAIESAKQLQKSWRDIGFAGNHKDGQLWHAFRQANDQLFQQRQQVKAEQQAALTSQQQAFEEQLIIIEASLTNLVENNTEQSDTQELLSAKEEAEVLLQSVIANKPVIKSVAMRCERIIKQVEQTLEESVKKKEKQTWLNLFELMAVKTQNSQTAEELQSSSLFSDMTSFWQKRLQDNLKLTAPVNGNIRVDKTLEIEILANRESPAELANQRMKVQVQLMQEKMLSGNQIDLTQLLVDWLMLGALTESELPLIERLKGIYCA